MPLIAFSMEIIIVGLFKDKAVLQIDGTQRILQQGDTSPEGIRLLAANSEEAVLEINGQQMRRPLASHINSYFARPQNPTVHIWPEQGMYKVRGSINGGGVDFLVDTGATLVALSEAMAQRLGIDFRSPGKRRMVSTASGLAPAHQVVLDRVTIGEIELRRVEAVVLEGDALPHALLGMSFLGRLEMRNTGQVLELQKKF
jgi:aspartyl protease family protein